MTASPSPMTRCHETIASTTLSVATGAVPPIANSSENTSAATGTLTKAATAAAGATTAEPLGQHRADRLEDQPAHCDADQRHQGDVGAEGGDAAVGHEEGLDQQHRAHAQHRGPGPDEHGSQRPPEQMSAGAGPDREVDHLAGEDERGDEAGHRGGTVVEFPAGPAQRQCDAADRDHTGRDGRRGVEEPVGNVHASHPTLLQVVRNKPFPDRSHLP